MNVGELLNLVGLGTGVVLYAMLLAMVIRAAGPSAREAQRIDPLLLITAILGVSWNLCALLVYELPKIGVNGPFPRIGAVGFSALGFLPAVVVHSVLRGSSNDVRGPVKRMLAFFAYAVSAVAVILHALAIRGGDPVPSPLAMRVLTYSFVALIVPLAVATRGQSGSRRTLWVAALAVFAVSALHLSQLHGGEASWPVELVGHHASLPLALAILYQDYPFALADLFLKRAIALLTVVSTAFVAIATFGARSEEFAAFGARDPRQIVVLVSLWVATALLYPMTRRAIGWFVDAIVLRRPDYGSLRANIARHVQTGDTISGVLTDVCELLAPAFNSGAVTWREWMELDNQGQSPALWRRTNPASVAIPTSEPPQFVITIADLTGGRRLLSDDVATLESIALMAARRIDAIRITNERHHREVREREIEKLATEAELRALRAQVNPHFLFNALTTIGHLIQTAPPQALHTLFRLTTLLRAVLRSEGEYTTLGRELDVIESYLDIEHARFDERLRIQINVPRSIRHFPLPALVLQALVENAVKHGISQKEAGGEVIIAAYLDLLGPQGQQVVLVVQDTGAGATPEAFRRGRDQGIGLRNIERRLEHHYGEAASLAINSVVGVGTVVEVRIPWGTAIVPRRMLDQAAV